MRTAVAANGRLPRFAGNHRHGPLALALGPLTDHFSSDYEIETVIAEKAAFDEQFTRFFHHENLAVETRVHVGTVAVFRVQQHILVFLDDINEVQWDTELFGHPQRVIAFGFGAFVLADRMGVAFDAETREKIYSFDVHTLVHHHPGGEH